MSQSLSDTGPTASLVPSDATGTFFASHYYVLFTLRNVFRLGSVSVQLPFIHLHRGRIKVLKQQTKAKKIYRTKKDETKLHVCVYKESMTDNVTFYIRLAKIKHNKQERPYYRLSKLEKRTQSRRRQK